MINAKGENVSAPWEKPSRSAQDQGADSMPMPAPSQKADPFAKRLTDQLRQEISATELSIEKLNMVAEELDKLTHDIKRRIYAQMAQVADLKTALRTVESHS